MKSSVSPHLLVPSAKCLPSQTTAHKTGISHECSEEGGGAEILLRHCRYSLHQAGSLSAPGGNLKNKATLKDAREHGKTTTTQAVLAWKQGAGLGSKGSIKSVAR